MFAPGISPPGVLATESWVKEEEEQDMDGKEEEERNKDDKQGEEEEMGKKEKGR